MVLDYSVSRSLLCAQCQRDHAIFYKNHQKRQRRTPLVPRPLHYQATLHDRKGLTESIINQRVTYCLESVSPIVTSFQPANKIKQVSGCIEEHCFTLVPVSPLVSYISMLMY